MQIIRHHKNVYKFYVWARTQEWLDAYRIKYEGSVRDWEALRAEGVCVAKCAEFVGISRSTYYRQKRVLPGFGASHYAAVKSNNTPQQITMGRGRKAAGT